MARLYRVNSGSLTRLRVGIVTADGVDFGTTPEETHVRVHLAGWFAVFAPPAVRLHKAEWFGESPAANASTVRLHKAGPVGALPSVAGR